MGFLAGGGEGLLKTNGRVFLLSMWPMWKVWRTKEHHNVMNICAVDCCCFCQAWVQLRSFDRAAYGTIITELFIMIDRACIVLFALAELIKKIEIRTKNTEQLAEEPRGAWLYSSNDAQSGLPSQSVPFVCSTRSRPILVPSPFVSSTSCGMGGTGDCLCLRLNCCSFSQAQQV